MILAATLTLTLVAPQLRIEPARAVVGQELVVRVERSGEVLAGANIVAELPDGSERSIGATASDGTLPFVPEAPGEHVFRTEVGGVLMITPCRVVAARSRWLIGAVCVPLGLALLWSSLRRGRDRRGP